MTSSEQVDHNFVEDSMYFKLVVDGPLPDEANALLALDAVRVICALGGVDPFLAWRDHQIVTDWNQSGNGTVGAGTSEAERAGASVWESALTATRRALQWPAYARLEIDMVGTCHVPEAFGPDREIWRACSKRLAVDIGRRLLTKRLDGAHPRCL